MEEVETQGTSAARDSCEAEVIAESLCDGGSGEAPKDTDGCNRLTSQLMRKALGCRHGSLVMCVSKHNL